MNNNKISTTKKLGQGCGWPRVQKWLSWPWDRVFVRRLETGRAPPVIRVWGLGFGVWGLGCRV